ncbi:MAG TPA: AmmeMemoRadiSam system radical SAM enzyme [Clostridiales bacterium UBA8960]|nr:AmmeMemoRadiSam system radical SAM enzyme [Clostridiales bacterium UBA8960]
MSHETKALYWIPVSNDVVKCELCPHECVIQPNHFGRCHTRQNRDGQLIATNYGRVCSYAYDPIEKKPLLHYQSGSTIFSIGTFGCNLTCDFCQNHELVHFEGEIAPISDRVLLNLAQDQGSIGIAYTYNEPTVWFEYVLHMCKEAKAIGLKNILVTNGFINEEPMMELLPYIDAMNIDLKAMTSSYYQNICGGDLDPVLRTIERCARHTHVEITTLLIDGLNTSKDELEALCQWLSYINPEIPLHLNRYFPNYKMTLPKTRLETLTQARDIAGKYLKHVHVGNAFI